MKIKEIALFTLILILFSGCTNNSESSVKINKTIPAPVQGTPLPTESGPSYTFTPTESGPSYTFTPTPVGVYFIPNANVNCRFGPDREFKIIDIALKGQSYLINGRNYANDWYYLKFTSNEYCYVLATTGVASGDTSKVRVMLPISTPTEVVSSSTSCSDFTSEATCNAHSICKWNLPVTRPGYCDKK